MPQSLNLGTQHALVMGIINITPDSFYSGSRVANLERAVQTARDMVLAGADIIDIGGESTRPGATDVSVADECRRVVPVIEALRQAIDLPISIDTTKADVMQAAIAAGATMINDVRALQEPGALEVAALTEAPVCLMHMQGLPRTMQINPQYTDLIAEITHFFEQRINACLAAGIKRENLILDPGFGFGKTPQHNVSLIKHLKTFKSFSCPVLVGVSRKSTIGHYCDAEPEQRLAGSLALTALAVNAGAKIIRTHDVKATRDAITMTHAVQQAP